MFWQCDRVGENELSIEKKQNLNMYLRLLGCRREVEYCHDELERFIGRCDSYYKRFTAFSNDEDISDDWVLQKFISTLALYYKMLPVHKMNYSYFRAYKRRNHISYSEDTAGEGDTSFDDNDSQVADCEDADYQDADFETELNQDLVGERGGLVG